ncbi:hypothetical protein LUD75_14390 [Epilithonimonas sp. JDS]|uniref:hypothetical protein n=1 Tax=Epilithonimonas sp. JDS TaxID=2902797 RepID=UPI001E48DDD2|nr:hypothetical protein [Epilithonimonas sp. JDS]MCD9855911.1 hypothetical protein [Epilithonimonas sp. JDS]
MENLNFKAKKTIFLLTLFSFLISCTDHKKTVLQNQSGKRKDSVRVQKFHSDNNETLNNWVDYYKKIDPDFNLDNFEFESENSFDKIAGNIYGIYDKEFDKLYSDFLIYSPNRQKYIDIDSYHWSLDDEGKPGFEVDQEINLVDISNKKIEKIAFYGSSNWVEDAYWKDDQTIVLLENSYEQRPAIREMNFNSMKSRTFKYQDSLKTISEYSKERIMAKLRKQKTVSN